MAQISASALIPAQPQEIYAIIADYHYGHQQIIPRPPFVSLAVEEGGIGKGTVIFVKMRMLGQDQSFRSVISEPEPGRVLVETNDNGYVTTFTVDPRADEQQAYVTISTDIGDRPGIRGALELWFLNRLLHPVYVRELELLAGLAIMRSR